MKTLTEYLLQESNENLDLFIESADNDYILIEEGFWNKLGKIVGKGATKAKEAIGDFSDGFKTTFTTVNTVGAQSKDNETLKMLKKLNSRVADASSEKEAYLILKDEAEILIKDIDNINKPNYMISVKNLLLTSDDAACKKAAENLEKAIEEKFGKKAKAVEEKVEKLNKKIEKSNIVPKSSKNNKGKKGDQPKSKKSASLGLSDKGEEKATSAKQEKKAIEKEIKSDQTFFASMAKEANIDAQTLRDSVVGLINNALKEEVVDKDGKKIYKWKKDTKGFQAKNEDNLIKGLACMFCGLSMINHKTINEKVVEILIDTGFSRQDYIKNLVKNKE